MTLRDDDREAPRPDTAARGVVWRLLAPLSAALIACALLLSGSRLARPSKVYHYTEGPVLGSLAALEHTGELSALYPADGWSEAPTVLTLYPPVYFLVAAAADRITGRTDTLLGLRLVSALGTAIVLGLLVLAVRRRRPPVPWLLALAAAVLVTPGVLSVAAGAQPDVLGLAWTWIGVTAALALTESPSGGGRAGALWWCAGLAFLMAFFTKQSYVAAPAALVLTLLLTGRRGHAAAFGTALCLAALIGVALLDRITSGGYTANTIDALGGSFAWHNLRSTMAATRPAQWLPLVAAAALGMRDIRRSFPEIYLIVSALLHTAAMLKTGSSANYLLEPAFALLLLAVQRGHVESPRPGRTGPSGWRAVAVAVVAAAVTLGSVAGALRELPTARGWLASERFARTAAFDGSPLVDPQFIPAVLEQGERPWLNDPFAFGVLEETGGWDPSPLVADLEAGRIPFVLTIIDSMSEPAPPGQGTRELVLAYFWRSFPVWHALTASYVPTTAGDVTLWLPAAETLP